MDGRHVDSLQSHNTSQSITTSVHALGFRAENSSRWLGALALDLFAAYRDSNGTRCYKMHLHGNDFANAQSTGSRFERITEKSSLNRLKGVC